MGQGIVREFEIDMYTLLCLKWITNKDLLNTAWNSVQYGSLDRREIWGRMTTHIVVVVESLSYVQQTLCALWTAAHQTSLSLHCLPEFAQIHVI